MSKRKWAAIAILATHILNEENDLEHCENKNNKRMRSVWTNNWLKKRDTDGYCAKLMHELRAEEPALYRGFVRLTADQFDNLLHLVTPYIQKNDTNMRFSISPANRLTLCCDTWQQVKISRLCSTFSVFRRRLYHGLSQKYLMQYTEYLSRSIKLPKNEEEWEAVSQQFNQHWHFPNCIGAVDGKHVVMIAPANSGSVFYNYKGTHSIVLMGTADA